MLEEKIKCPECDKELDVDSVREHKNGQKRVYWECQDCEISIMKRNTK